MMLSKENRPNRDESKHTRRRTLEDSLGFGKLNVEGMDPNYHYRIENDIGNKIDQLKEIGYEVVSHGGTERMGDVNAKEVGTAITTTVDKFGTKAVLLKQPKEFREEDVAFEQSQIDKSEAALFRQAETEKGRYGKIEKE